MPRPFRPLDIYYWWGSLPYENWTNYVWLLVNLILSSYLGISEVIPESKNCGYGRCNAGIAVQKFNSLLANSLTQEKEHVK